MGKKYYDDLLQQVINKLLVITYTQNNKIPDQFNKQTTAIDISCDQILRAKAKIARKFRK